MKDIQTRIKICDEIEDIGFKCKLDNQKCCIYSGYHCNPRDKKRLIKYAKENTKEDTK
jgi:hypothetical protein